MEYEGSVLELSNRRVVLVFTMIAAPNKSHMIYYVVYG